MHTHRLKIPRLGEVYVIGNSDWSGEITISWGDTSNGIEVRLPDGLLPALVAHVVSEKIRQKVEKFLDSPALDRFFK